MTAFSVGNFFVLSSYAGSFISRSAFWCVIWLCVCMFTGRPVLCCRLVYGSGRQSQSSVLEMCLLRRPSKLWMMCSVPVTMTRYRSRESLHEKETEQILVQLEIYLFVYLFIYLLQHVEIIERYVCMHFFARVCGITISQCDMLSLVIFAQRFSVNLFCSILQIANTYLFDAKSRIYVLLTFLVISIQSLLVYSANLTTFMIASVYITRRSQLIPTKSVISNKNHAQLEGGVGLSQIFDLEDSRWPPARLAKHSFSRRVKRLTLVCIIFCCSFTSGSRVGEDAMLSAFQERMQSTFVVRELFVDQLVPFMNAQLSGYRCIGLYYYFYYSYMKQFQYKRKESTMWQNVCVVM